MKSHRGQNLIEVMIAIAMFVILITGGLTLLFQHLTTLQRSRELVDINNIATETYEALKSISYTSWAQITPGIYGLTIIDNTWQLQAAPDFINNKYLRTITITAMNRDDSCQLVLSGGSADPDTKKIALSLTWTSSGQNLSRQYSKLSTDWKNPTTCVVAQGQAGSLDLNVSGSYIDSTKKSILGTTIKNTSPSPITIDKMQLTWTKPGEITYIKINGVNHWHSTNGTGTPQGDQPSGTLLDLVDFVLTPGATYSVSPFRFEDKIDGSTVTIKIIMSDGTSITEVTSPPFVP